MNQNETILLQENLFENVVAKPDAFCPDFNVLATERGMKISVSRQTIISLFAIEIKLKHTEFIYYNFLLIVCHLKKKHFVMNFEIKWIWESQQKTKT